MEHFSTLKEIVLKKITFRNQFRFNEVLRLNTDIRIIEGQFGHLADRQLCQIDMHIYGQEDKQVYSTTYTVPDGWFQCFKEEVLKGKRGRLFKWFLKKYPIQYRDQKREFEFSHRALFDELITSNPTHRIVMQSEPNVTAHNLVCKTPAKSTNEVKRDRRFLKHKFATEHGIHDAPFVWWESMDLKAQEELLLENGFAPDTTVDSDIIKKLFND